MIPTIATQNNMSPSFSFDHEISGEAALIFVGSPPSSHLSTSRVLLIWFDQGFRVDDLFARPRFGRKYELPGTITIFAYLIGSVCCSFGGETNYFFLRSHNRSPVSLASLFGLCGEIISGTSVYKATPLVSLLTCRYCRRFTQ
jgi:hypothetical protein